MKTTTSIAELLNGGLRFEADEAVAIAQQLIDRLGRSDDTGRIHPPYGPPDAANVFLNADGSIHCAGCDTPPTVSEVAILLDTLLPAGSPRVPGGLRYAIARGMLDVDVAPFDSLEDFSETLARHEHSPRDAAVRALLARAASQCTALARRPAAFDRRVARTTTTTDLRRELRHVDARLYQQQLARASAMMSAPPLVATAPVRPAYSRTSSAIAACLGAGFLLIGAGEFMHSHRWMETASAASAMAPWLPVAPAIDEPAPLPAIRPAVADLAAPRAIRASSRLYELRAPLRSVTPRAVPARAVAKPSTRSSSPTPAVNRVRVQRQSTGVMDRLRLGWLRNAFKTSL
jgi:urease accessory protein UreF